VVEAKERLTSPNRRQEDLGELSLRPRLLAEMIGQDRVKENLSILIQAAKARGEALDHVLFYSPPGLGKTTFAHILANEMGVKIKVTSGPAIERAGDLAAILTNLQSSDILFIDEIHRLGRVVEEILYPAMEDYALDITIGKGPSARSIRLNLPHFTVVGATTRLALLTAPLRSRFGVIHRLGFYDPPAMEVALRLLRRVRDYAQVRADGCITRSVAKEALTLLEIDDLGLDNADRTVLTTIIVKFQGGPVGLQTIAASISEEPDTIMDVVEPYLLQLGFIDRTPQGRVATPGAYQHLGLEPPTTPQQRLPEL